VGKFETFEGTLDGARAAALIAGFSQNPTFSFVELPKFTFSFDFPLSGVLKNLGMRDAFDPVVADFSGIDGARDLFIDDVLHKAFIDVNEAGTEAAAATGVIIGITTVPGITITINQPFIFLIHDNDTGAILFIGRVLQP
jgi:serpin B